MLSTIIVTAAITMLVCAAIYEPLFARIHEVDSAIDYMQALPASKRGCSCGMADYGAPGHDGYEQSLDDYFETVVREQAHERSPFGQTS